MTYFFVVSFWVIAHSTKVFQTSSIVSCNILYNICPPFMLWWDNKENAFIMKSGPVIGVSLFALSSKILLLWIAACGTAFQFGALCCSGAVLNTILNRIVIRGFCCCRCYYSFIESFSKELEQFLKDYDHFMTQKTKAHSKSWESWFYNNFVRHPWKKLLHFLVISWFSHQDNCII